MLDAGAELEAALRPVTWPDAQLMAGGGNYLRAAGSWIYTASQRPVPGAVDVTFGRRYAGALRVTRDDGEFVLLDRAWLEGPESRPELRWCIPLGTLSLNPADPVAVPVDEILARSAVVVGLSAPELDPEALLTASAIARLLGVSRSTVNAYHARHQMPPPVATLNNRLPLWTRPVIDHWAARQTRRRRPAL
jgi:predicted DNA-binding transcriptional regulator AlpA